MGKAWQGRGSNINLEWFRSYPEDQCGVRIGSKVRDQARLKHGLLRRNAGQLLHAGRVKSRAVITWLLYRPVN